LSSSLLPSIKPSSFASVGLSFDFSVFTENINFVVLLIAVVMIGQWIGTGGAAYFFGKFSFRKSSIIAFALAGRGVMEIIMAKELGLKTGLLDKQLFSAVVAVAITTTFLSPILLKLILPKSNQIASK